MSRQIPAEARLGPPLIGNLVPMGKVAHDAVHAREPSCDLIAPIGKAATLVVSAVPAAGRVGGDTTYFVAAVGGWA